MAIIKTDYQKVIDALIEKKLNLETENKKLRTMIEQEKKDGREGHETLADMIKECQVKRR